MLSTLPPVRQLPDDRGVLGIAGTAITAKAFNAQGRLFFLNPSHVNANDSNPGEDPNYPCLTLAGAFAKCTANQHDTIVYVAGAPGLNLSAALVWNKNYTHLIGVCAPTMVGQRARIFQLSTLTGASAD